MPDDVISATIKTYDEIAEKYYKRYFNYDESYLMDFFIKNLNGKKILDVGSGPGRDAMILSEKGFDVIGIDLSSAFITMGKKNAPKAMFMKMDMRKLEFSDGTFDGVWAIASFLHIPKDQAKQTLLELKRVLKKDGMLLIAVKEGSGEGFDENKKFPRFFSYYTTEELNALLESCGFTIMRNARKATENVMWISVFARK